MKQMAPLLSAGEGGLCEPGKLTEGKWA